MARRKLRIKEQEDGGETASIGLPKDDLDRDGLVDENGEIEHTFGNIDRVDERTFRVELVDPEELSSSPEDGSQ